MQAFDTLVRKKDGKPLRYLVVDDSVFARKNLQKILAMFGGEVAGEADDGRKAIEVYEEVRPDMVLMDITMPDMEGIEAAERITQRNPQARIVIVSSVGYQENISQAFKKGALHFVQKPPKPEVLYEVIKRVLGDEGATTADRQGEA